MFFTPSAYASAPAHGRPPRASASTASGLKPSAWICAARSSTAVPRSSQVICSRITGRIPQMETGLGGKRVLVTGASGGMGSACARACAAEGAEVVVHYHRGRDRAEALAGELGGAQIVVADLTREEEVDRLFAQAGPLEVCAAVAGAWPAEDVPVWELPLQRWRDTVDANLTATFLTARGFLRQLERDGALVLVSSTAGLFGEAGHADYAAAKSAIL